MDVGSKGYMGMTQVHLLAPALCLSSHKLIPKSHGANSSTYVSFALRGYADTGICKGSLNLLGIFLLHNQKGFIGFGIVAKRGSTCYQIIQPCSKLLTCAGCSCIISKPDLTCVPIRAYLGYGYGRTTTAATGVL